MTTGAASTTSDGAAPAPPPRPEPVPDPAAGDDIGAVVALPRVVTLLGTVVAPTTLLTALLLYFGRLHVTGLFRHLRVPATIVDLTPQDYLIRSVDGLFVPFAVAAGGILVALWSTALLAGVVPQATRRVVMSRIGPLVALVGLTLVGLAVAGVNGSAAFAGAPEVPGLLLAAGALLLAQGLRPALRRFRRSPSLLVAEWAAVFMVVAVGLFWAVGSYAIGVGLQRGRQITDNLSTTSDAVLFSEKALAVSGPGITERDCGDPEGAYRYRYDGLKLILRTDAQYFFLPVGWTRVDGSAIVLPRTDAVRVEFAAPGTVRPATC